jgi:hypothetical protein
MRCATGLYALRRLARPVPLVVLLPATGRLIILAVDRVRVDVRRRGTEEWPSPFFRANLMLTSQRKRLPLVAKSPVAPDVFSNSYRALLFLAVPSDGFEPRRPRHSFQSFTTAFWAWDLPFSSHCEVGVN